MFAELSSQIQAAMQDAGFPSCNDCRDVVNQGTEVIVNSQSFKSFTGKVRLYKSLQILHVI